MLRRLCLLASFSLSVVSFILHHVFSSFSLVSSRLSPISVPFPVFDRRMSVRPPVLLLFVSRRVPYLIWYFLVHSTVYNGLPCVLPLLVLASVRLSRIFDRVFGY